MKATTLSFLLLFPAVTMEAGPVADLIKKAHQDAVESGVAADRSIDTLEKLAASRKEKDDQHRFGIPLDAPPSIVKRGASQPVYEVGLDTLRDFHPTAEDPSSLHLLTDARRVFYFVNAPLIVSSVEVIKREGAVDWTTFKLGQQNYTKLLATTIAGLDLSPDQTMIVEIPALQLRFVAFARQIGTEETLMLASVIDAPELGIAKGAARAATEMFKSLAPAAKKHDGLPT